MEVDLLMPERIMFKIPSKSEVRVTDGVTSAIIIEAASLPYDFEPFSHFTQLSATKIALSSTISCCVHIPDRMTNTSTVIGEYKGCGYEEGIPGKFGGTTALLLNNQNTSQMFVVDGENKAIRVVDIESGSLSTFVTSDLITQVQWTTITQRSNGDLFLTQGLDIFKIAYADQEVRWQSGGKVCEPDYTDCDREDFAESSYSWPGNVAFLSEDIALHADAFTNTLYKFDLNREWMFKLTIPDLNLPLALLVTDDSLYIGQEQTIRRIKCK